MDLRRAVCGAMLFLLCGGSLTRAQTTGRVVGSVADTSGGVIPGAVVTARASSLPGVASTTSDREGEFRLLALPPGVYTVTVELSGFRTVVQPAVVVGLDRTATVSFRLEIATMSETLNVLADSPTVDVTSTATGVNATADLFTRLPVQRDVYSLASLVPGTQKDRIGAAVYGSTGAENVYIIEGLNVTGAERGQERKWLNFDFVEEVEVKTGGLPAEYGRSTGGVTNVLTRSGGNELRGGLFGFYEGGKLQADNSTAGKRPATTPQIDDIADKWDYGAELGGYLVKDTLWFFGAYNRTNRTDRTTVIRDLQAPGAPGVGSQVPTDLDQHLFAGKLTWRPGPSHTITASVFGDPGRQEGTVFQILGPESTWKGFLDVGATDAVLRYDGTFGSKTLLRALYGRHAETWSYGGEGTSEARFVDTTVVPVAVTGGFPNFSDRRFRRDVLKLDLTRFVGRHELKVGGDYEWLDARVDFRRGAGEQVARLSAGGTTFFGHSFWVDTTAPGYDRNDRSTWTKLLTRHSEPFTRNLSLYAQDSWKATASLTLNLGLRWERQDVQGQGGGFTLNDSWAPRLGLVWDVVGNGRSKLFGSYGRFYESIPMDINVRTLAEGVNAWSYNFDPTPGAIIPDPAAPFRSGGFGFGATPVDPDLRGQYIDEWLAGLEYEVVPNLVLGTRFVHRTLGRVIEDFLVDNVDGVYATANPGEGSLGRTVYFYDFVHSAPAPRAERRATSLELTARKRWSGRWQLLASYVWSRLEGNYDGLFQNATGQLDPNLNSAFDFADFMVNAEGRLAAERAHQVKLDGSYQFSGTLDGLNVGLSAWWFSGLPLNAYGYSFAYGNSEYYLVPRGSLGRGPSDREAHLHVSYPLRLTGRTRLNLILDVFNIFNRQAITRLDERYNTPQDGPCAGIPDGLCNGDGGLLARPGTLVPQDEIADPRATATNPDYLKKGADWISPAFTGQRSLRLGVRLTF
jgi:outer membrane receptor protein involved in Fe transport